VPAQLRLPPRSRRREGSRRVHPAPRPDRGGVMLDRIREKGEDGKGLGRGGGAHEARLRRIPEPRVTFVIDTNPNYTNVCITDCQFCAFYRRPGDKEAYTLTRSEEHTS